MNRRNASWSRAFGLLLWSSAVLWGTGSCGEAQSTGSGETHFLARCQVSCGAGFYCVCGVCTTPCDADSQCAEYGAAAECVMASASCGVSKLVCDAGCTDDQACAGLGSSYRCTAGRCRYESGPKGNSASGGSAGSSEQSSGGQSLGGRASGGQNSGEESSGGQSSAGQASGGQGFGGQNTAGDGTGAERSLASLAGTKQLFFVDRVYNRETSSLPQSAELPESTYVATEQGNVYAVQLADDLKSLTLQQSTGDTSFLGDQLVAGTLNQQTPERLQYDLSLFAGGRFLVWVDGAAFGAELTVYGSGVPIISSERGVLRVER